MFSRIVRAVRYRAIDLVFRRLFPVWQSLGFHVTRNHYYEPIPDTRTLRDELWQRRSDLVGVDMREAGQLELLSMFASRYKDEYDRFPLTKDQTSKPYEYFVDNGVFAAVDGEVLYCMIRHFRPRRIFEIGSGYSTRLSAQAVLRNRTEDESYECELVAIEPYPREVLKAGFPGLTRLQICRAQDVPVQEFMKLEANDILFIDSSHVLSIGSDVQYEFLEIIPRLQPGVLVHLHDIFFPLEYPRWRVLGFYRFWTEQYLLQAFLAFNSSFEVLWAGHYMLVNHPDKLRAVFGSFDKTEVWTASCWMRRKL